MNICRVNEDTNRYYDGLAKAKSSREPSAREINLQLEILTEEKFFEINDDTVDAFIRCRHEWEIFATFMEDKNIHNLTPEQEKAIAKEAFFYFQAIKQQFINSNKVLATELAQEIIDNDCQ